MSVENEVLVSVRHGEGQGSVVDDIFGAENLKLVRIPEHSKHKC